MAVNNKRAVLRLAAGALSLPAAFLLGGCSLRLPQGEAAREPEPTTTMAAPPVSEEPLSEEERWQQLVQKACKATWNGQNLDAEVYRQRVGIVNRRVMNNGHQKAVFLFVNIAPPRGN